MGGGASSCSTSLTVLEGELHGSLEDSGGAAAGDLAKVELLEAGLLALGFEKLG